MAFNFKHLTEEVRMIMIEEVNLDFNNGNLYISNRLSHYGKQIYPQLLLKSIKNGNEEDLAKSLEVYLNSHEQRKNPKGGYTLVKVSSTAAYTLAEGEFNRFYIRALCRVALSSGKRLKVYRAQVSINPRRESEMKIGKFIDARVLLEDLRSNSGVETALGLPPGPNSGLSVELVV